MYYPTADELLEAGYTLEPLYIRQEIMRALDLHTPPLATERSQAPRPKFLSRYVGVTKRHGVWMAQWGKRGEARQKGFGKEPEGERMAAEYRARVLGLAEVEVRP